MNEGSTRCSTSYLSPLGVKHILFLPFIQRRAEIGIIAPRLEGKAVIILLYRVFTGWKVRL